MKRMTDIELVPLEEILERRCDLRGSQAAGFHNLDKAAIYLDQMSSALTSKHENFHDEILFHTSFGSLQRHLTMISNTMEFDADARELIDSWVRLSLQQSRMAHEVYATYLSIKSFSRDVEAELIARHPAKYREYYSILASCIDRFLGSSYLQFLVGKALVSAAFSSTLSVRVSSPEEFESLLIYPEEAPNHRLERILSSYQNTIGPLVDMTVKERFASVEARGLVPDGFDPLVEADWVSLPARNAERLEGLLLLGLYQMILPTIENSLELPVYNYDPAMQQREIAKLLETCRALAKEEDRWEISAQGTSEPLSEKKLKRHRIGETRIINRWSRSQEAVRVIDAHQLDQYMKAGNLAITRERYAGADEIEWRLLLFADGRTTQFALNDETLLHALRVHRPSVIARGGIDILESVVFGVCSLGALPFMYERYFESVATARPATIFDTAFWYMGGNIVEWVDHLLSQEAARIYVMTFLGLGTDDETYLRSQRDGKLVLPSGLLNAPNIPPRMIVLATESSLGYYARLIPGYEASKLLTEVIPPNVERFPDGERKYLKAVTSKMFNALVAAWDVM